MGSVSCEVFVRGARRAFVLIQKKKAGPDKKETEGWERERVRTFKCHLGEEEERAPDYSLSWGELPWASVGERGDETEARDVRWRRRRCGGDAPGEMKGREGRGQGAREVYLLRDFLRSPLPPSVPLLKQPCSPPSPPAPPWPGPPVSWVHEQVAHALAGWDRGFERADRPAAAMACGGIRPCAKGISHRRFPPPPPPPRPPPSHLRSPTPPLVGPDHLA